jgi:hypothetical protein
VTIADVRDQFAPRTAPTSEDEMRAFVDAKLNTIRTDPRLSPAEKARAISELEHKLQPENAGPTPG